MKAKLLTAILLLCCGSVALGQSSPSASGAAAPAAAVRGTLVRVEGHTLVVKVQQGDKAKDVELVVGENVELRLDGKPVELKDLQPGTFIDAVRIAARGRMPERLI